MMGKVVSIFKKKLVGFEKNSPAKNKIYGDEKLSENDRNHLRKLFGIDEKK